MVVVALLSVDLVESVDLVSVELVVNCITEYDTFCLFDLAPQVLKMYDNPPESCFLGAVTGVGFKLIASGT